MALTYGFYNSLDGDRRYNADQLSAIFDGIISDGVYSTIGKAFTVSAGTGMQVNVGSGRAWFNHTWSLNDADIPLAIEPADVTLTRIDAVVLEINADETVRKNSVKVLKGTAATSPTRPTLTKSEFVNQYPLAYVTVTPGATAILSANITNAVGTSECPFVTGIIDTVDIDNFLQQWDGEFDIWLQENEEEFMAWWNTIKATLDTNTVTRLQNQIDERVKTSDQATVAEAQAGTNASKWMSPARVAAYISYILATQAEAQAGTSMAKLMTPARVKNYMDSIKATSVDVAAGTNNTKWITPTALKGGVNSLGLAKRRMVRFNSSSNFTVPTGAVNNAFKVICVGGGGGGSVLGGGGSGYITIEDLTLTPGTTYAITIGAGGARSVKSDVAGGTGGTTTFGDLVSANGGTGGGTSTSYGGGSGNAGGGANGTGKNGGNGGMYGGGGGGSGLGPGKGGNGGMYGGGGGGGYTGSSGGAGGAGGTYGGNGGNGGNSNASGSNGTIFETSTLELFPYIVTNMGGIGGTGAVGAGGGGGGYGGNGGNGHGYGGGGGGGYGGNGGSTHNTTERVAGAGGGGYGGNGGNAYKYTIGGGGGFFGNGGGALVFNDLDDGSYVVVSPDKGSGGGGAGTTAVSGGSSTAGASGCCVILYDV